MRRIGLPSWSMGFNGDIITVDKGSPLPKRE